MDKKKKTRNSSKIYVKFSIIQFIIVLLYSILCSIKGFDGSNLCYLIPSSAGIVGIALGFYYNKAKTENLSKQRIRYVYLKMFLENKLTQEQYLEIENELENIDNIINNKLNYELQDSINENINNSI